MNYSEDKSWEHFESVFNAKLPVKEAWGKIIDFHEQLKPKKYWDSLRQLEVEPEQEEIKEWMADIVTLSPIPKGIAALWIGITKIYDEEDKKELYAIYLSGAKSYDKDYIDWAVKSTYKPDENFGILDVLNQMDEIIKKDKDDYSFLDWILPLAYCALTLDEIIRTKSMNKQHFLKNNPKLFVTVGFDEGDFVNLTSIE
ncbi:hypothetical protein [Williamwhitmania taraxaci]|uniref:Uncharacterized protein n=1 Tax=Williamwhitmania taraxaci TaxID=1640674 RepID=A0A1G6LQ36_9BACT|nr:hypothetical protein [Williamwhitmania taraxaci]SDC45382.1 hypothetical protein SAMN05216323_103220 [Williamwhitmania taraxaci]